MNAHELIQSYYDAFNAKNFGLMMEYLSNDVIHDINQGERTIGRDVFVNFMKEMDSYYDENLSNITIMISVDGKRAAAEFICSGVYKTTANGLPPAKMQKYSLPVGCFFEIRDNKISRVTNYYNMPDWINQVK